MKNDQEGKHLNFANADPALPYVDEVVINHKYKER
jgi:hypothetical protein